MGTTTSTGPSPTATERSPVELARQLGELLEANADDAERLRRLPAVTVDALVESGLMRLCVPAAYGGPEVDPITLVEVIATLARADGAAAWCSMIASTTSSMAAFLPEAGAREIYADPTSVTGGVFAPNGVGVVAGDRVTVSGRWAWGSGTQHCDWILGGARCDDDRFRLCWFPAETVTFHDTWHTGGMRGSGSLDFEVEAAVVPLDHTMQPGVSPPVVESPLARFPNFSLLAAAVSAVGLGVARHALDELRDLADGKRPQFSSKTLGQHAFTQIELARAEGRWRAADAYLRSALERAWGAAVAGEPVDVESRTNVRLAAVHAAAEAAAVTDVVFTLAGGTAVYDTSVLGRCQRDAHVVTQHIQTAPKLYEKIGRLELGVPDDVSMW